MSSLKIFSVRDMKAQVYLKPSVMSSVADAVRSFETVVNEGDSMLSKFPADFRLHHLADFDPLSGQISVLETPSDLGCALDFMKRSEPTPLTGFDRRELTKAQATQ